MVYCKLKKNNNDSAVYGIGTTVDDMTGEIIFYKGTREPELIKQAEKYPIRFRSIAKIFGKYGNDLEKGKFPDKMAYEAY